MDVTLSLIIDLIVLAMLAVTIFYAVRLSSALSNFKQHRSQFEKLIANLSINIQSAYTAIDALKDNSRSTAADLGESISEAKYLIDELRIMNEASNNMAERLERASEQGRKTPPPPNPSSNDEPDTQKWSETLKPSQKKKEDADESFGGFMIRDRDFSEEVDDSEDHNRIVDFKRSETKTFASKAEKDLYETLQKNKKG